MSELSTEGFVSAVSGATGLVGKALVSRLGRVHALTRRPAAAEAALGEQVKAFGWQPEQQPAPAEALAGVEVVFHLAGEAIAEGRWSAAKKQRIRDSRVLGTRHMVAGLAAVEPRPRVLVVASAVGYYGDRGDEELDESAAVASGFLAEVCREWEAEALEAEKLGVRVVCARIGVVLASEGGALTKMIPPFKWGLGGRLGSGAQWMPWIHLDDVVGLLLLAATHEQLRGALNVVSPQPARNSEFTKALGRALGRPTPFAVPKFGLKLGFGEISKVLLASQRVVPRVALSEGYAFRYPELDPALRACVRP